MQKRKFKLDNYKTQCPSQWEGTDEEGRAVYIKYRWGRLRVEIGTDLIFKEVIGPPGDGFLSDEALTEFLQTRDVECEFYPPGRARKLFLVSKIEDILRDYEREVPLGDGRSFLVSPLGCEGSVRSLGRDGLCIQCALGELKRLIMEDEGES